MQGTEDSLLQLPVSIKRALEDRDYRPLYHLLCVIVILAAGCFLFYKSFGHGGTLMSTDMTWPDAIAQLQFKVSNTWTPYMSGPLTIDPIFLFWVYPTSMFARLLHLSASQYMFAMYFFTFCLAGISMYVLTYSTIRKISFKNSATYAVYAGALIAALIYMYNPWSITYLKPYFAYVLYALLPLVFLSMAKTFDSPSARNIILFSIFITFANTTYQLTWLWGLIFSYAIFFVAVTRPRRAAFKRTLWILFGTLVLFFLLNARWIFPYVGARLVGKPYVPFYGPELSRVMVTGLSSNNFMANNFRLLSVWTWSVDQLKGGFLFQALSFAIPVFALLGLVIAYREIRRNRTVTYWAVVAMLALLLTTGANFIIRRPYLYFTFNAPGSNIYGWLLRTSERWAFFVPLFFTLMIGVLLAKLLVKNSSLSTAGRSIGSRLMSLRDVAPWTDESDASEPSSADRLKRLHNNIAMPRYYRNTALAVVIAVLVLTSLFPKALSTAQTEFKPVTVPGDYAKLKSYLAHQPGQPRVAWMPFVGPWSFTYNWGNGGPVDAYGPSNSNPNLHSNYEIMNGNSYFNWLQSLYLRNTFGDVMLANGFKKDVLSELLVPFAARYLIFDKSVQGYDFGDNLDTEKSISLAYKTNFLNAFKTAADPGYIWGATRTVNTNSFYDNLAFAQKFTPKGLENVAFTDGKPYFGQNAKVSPKFGGADLDLYMTTVNKNSGFDVAWPDGQFPYWNPFPGSSGATVSPDSKIKVGGKNSLRIENKSTSSPFFVYGEELPVQPEGIYAMESNIKYRNVGWSEAGVQGFDPARGEWINLVYCPTIRAGSSDWQRHDISFYVPANITKIRAQLGGGWVQDAKKGPAVTWFDNERVLRVPDGIYTRLAEREKPPVITYEKISAEKYRVRVRGAKAPFVLVLSEEYDGKWTASTSDGKTVDSIPMYSTINGFPIDKTGNFDVVIEYQPQKWFFAGLILSLFVLFLSLLFLLYDWKGKAALAENGTNLKVSTRQHLNSLGAWTDRSAKKAYLALRTIPGELWRFLKGPPKRTSRTGRPRRQARVPDKIARDKKKDGIGARKSNRLRGASSSLRRFIEEPLKRGPRSRGQVDARRSRRRPRNKPR